MESQGEAYATHAQIGRNAPAKLLFSSMRWLNSPSWATLNISLETPDSPYGNDEPIAGQFENWTNAH